jgi:hypothetical protein
MPHLLLYATFHVEWSFESMFIIKERNKVIVFYNKFLGLDVHYNAHNKPYEIFSFFLKVYNVIICNKFNKRIVK